MDFPTFFNLSLNLARRSSWSEPQSAPSLVFADLFCLFSPSLAAKNIINLISVLAIWWCPCVESSLVLLEEGVFYDQCICSVQFSRSVMSDSLWPHESQHTRPPCPSPTPRVHSDSHPSSQWCHPAISSFVVPFSSCPQYLPAFAQWLAIINSRVSGLTFS